jgi:Holliday junction resolvase-like predicted endonuclease
MRKGYAQYARHKTGRWGENWVVEQLRQRGINARRSYRGEKGDVQAVMPETGQIVRIEVKTAHQSKDKKWRFTLWLAGLTDHRKADMVVLVALVDGEVVPFVIPVSELYNQRQAVITSHPKRYAGKLCSYRDNWNNLADCSTNIPFE